VGTLWHDLHTQTENVYCQQLSSAQVLFAFAPIDDPYHSSQPPDQWLELSFCRAFTLIEVIVVLAIHRHSYVNGVSDVPYFGACKSDERYEQSTPVGIATQTYLNDATVLFHPLHHGCRINRVLSAWRGFHRLRQTPLVRGGYRTPLSRQLRCERKHLSSGGASQWQITKPTALHLFAPAQRQEQR